MKKTTFFKLNDVEIIKSDNIIPQEVLKYGGIRLKDNLFELQPELIEKKIEQHPLVKKAKIKQNRFSKFIIEITERKPVAYVTSRKGEIFQIDREGYLMDLNWDTNNHRFPFITGISIETTAKGEKIKDEKVVLALNLMEALNEFFRDQISEINVSDRDNLYIYTIDGIKIFFDTVVDFKRKLPAIKLALLKLKRKYHNIDYIDLRYRNAFVMKPE